MKFRTNKDVKIIFSVTSGNFLEMYDFAIYGFYAVFIARIFFPAENEFISLMQSFIVFGAGFLMRPFGAVVLGAYMDKYGRRNGLIVTLAIMAIGTVSIALCPGYESIGILAPVIVLLGRLLQGFAAGAEIGGVSVYLAEIAPKNLRGFYVSWQSGSQQIATIFAGMVGVALHYLVGDFIMQEWGWRIPFILGCLIVPYFFYIRRILDETPQFKHANKYNQLTFSSIFESIRENITTVIFSIMFVMMTTVTFYFLTSFTPTYVNQFLHFSQLESFLITVIIGLSSLFWLPISGYLSDRIGRKPIALLMTVLGVISAYPVLVFLAHNISFKNLVFTELWFSFLFGAYNGVMVVSLSEIMPPNVKALGFSFSYSITVAIFGGFTPAISTFLTQKLNNPAAPGFWLTFAAFCSFVSALILFKKKWNL
ncbi:tricarballylate/proton symporter TcuC [Campylobacter sp. MIT 21-1685]|uniref:tricarballylate/proton symporter TcuC n=1 Tax=unclassified Campylobacter TaxID=2593542 RepID=UPI00224ADA18|nr:MULTISPECIES: tricarballylate/proton symporter TcuC [unclassified Campylobacter]MCX2683269.1 tricarballylate/proton symporter TcuC [Campylobacter sp. MIT 21-1684]MCX2751538.1 tricarballylate/proton symporter TcuC [Campylobacter sp. MIT 21-1682]MCX2807737.1 tricarballylate/proton symporter TcuC [Campylobacter sp. MIT 21-1685]